MSVLARASRADVALDPFPHLVLDDALDADLYEELVRTLPPRDLLTTNRENGPNYRTPAAVLLADARVDPWAAIVAEHTAPAFFAEVLALFGDIIRSLHPTLEKTLRKPLETSTHDRHPRRRAGGRHRLDCQITWTAPSRRSSAPCHVDREVARYAGLIYMRHPWDDSTGGDLQLFRFRGEPRGYRPNRLIPPALVEPVKTISYAANRLVFFPHSPLALHGVTPPALTTHPRLHINMLAELRMNIFRL